MKHDIESVPQTIVELARSIAIHVSGSSQFRRFQQLYKNDRVAFVHDIIPDFAITMADYGFEILGLFDEGNNRVSVRGPHGLGKTNLAAILVHHSVLTAEEDAKVPTTASAWRQLEHYLWPEIKKISKSINWSEVGREPYDPRTEFMVQSIKLNNGTVTAFPVASDDHNTIEGAHATRLVYIFDEAKSIPRATWNAAEGAFSNAGLRVPIYIEKGMEQYNVKGVIDYNDEELEIDSNVESDPVYGYARKDVRELVKGNGSKDQSIEDNVIDLDSGIRVGVISKDHEFRDLTHHHSSPAIDQSFDPTIQNQQSQSSEIFTENPTNSINQFANRIPRIYTGIRQSNKDLNKSIGLNTSQETPICYEALAFAISTPGEPSGQFYDIHMHKPGYEDWVTRHVTIDEAIKAGRISTDWVEQRKRQWGEDSSIYQNRVLGEFADLSEEGIIPLSWVRAAIERWKSWYHSGHKELPGKSVLGVDVARAGDDATVIALRNASVLQTLYSFSKLPLTSVAGHVKSHSGGRYIHIEMEGGYGASVYDMLREQGIPNLRPIVVSGSTTFRDRSKEIGFANVRAAMWWNVREMLDPQYGSEICLPPDERLTLDLITPHWTMLKNAVIQLEDKIQIMKRLGRSPDYGTAVCLAFWQASSGGGIVF